MSLIDLSLSRLLAVVILTLLKGGSSVTELKSCLATDGISGRCKLLDDCPAVYRDLVAGQRLASICGYTESAEAIVCCPIESNDTVAGTTTSRTSVVSASPPPPPPILERVGRVAERKCSEYASRVYALVDPPILSIDRARGPVNVSLCAIKTKKLIVGGTRADPREFPHMAAVGFARTDRDSPQPAAAAAASVAWLCGGTLVSERFVLTAAHCTFSLEYGPAGWVRLGDLNLAREDDDARPQTRRILRRIRHPDYARPAEYHDIALLELETRVTFDAYVRPACLPLPPPLSNNNDEERLWSQRRVIATGWGRVDWADDDASDNLLKVTLDTVSQEICNVSYFGDAGSVDLKLPRGILEQWQICAGREGRDTCQGDSGGPIVVFDPRHECMYDVVGITSLGRWCGSSVPGVYTRVAEYLPWLENILWSRLDRDPARPGL